MGAASGQVGRGQSRRRASKVARAPAGRVCLLLAQFTVSVSAASQGPLNRSGLPSPS